MQIYSYLHLLTSLIAVIVGIFFFRSLSNPLRVLFYLLIAMLAVDSYAVYRVDFFNPAKPNHWPAHFYMVVEFVLFFKVFRIWQIEQRVKSAIRILVPTMVLVCIINYAFFSEYLVIVFKADDNWIILFNSWAKYNFLPIRIAVPFYVAITAYTLYQLIKMDVTDIVEFPAFWVSGGLLLFMSTSVVYFIVLVVPGVPIKYIKIISNLMAISNVVANTFYTISFYIQHRYKKDDIFINRDPDQDRSLM